MLAAALLWLLARASLLSAELALGLFALWVVKDFALYPILRVGYEDVSHDVGEQLVGALGNVRSALVPDGWVRVGPELWRARCAPEAAPLPVDTPVRVMAVRGMLLEVEPLATPRDPATTTPSDPP